VRGLKSELPDALTKAGEAALRRWLSGADGHVVAAFADAERTVERLQQEGLPDAGPGVQGLRALAEARTERAITLWEQLEAQPTRSAVDDVCLVVLRTAFGLGMEARDHLGACAEALPSVARLLVRPAIFLKLPQLALSLALAEGEPRRGHDLAQLASLAFNAGVGGAERWATKALAGGELPEDALAQCIQVLVHAGGYGTALSWLRENAGDAPERVELLAELLLWDGDTGGARAAMAQARPSSQAERARWASVKGACNALEGDLKAAWAHLNEALELEPRDREATLWRAYVELKLGELEAARMTLRRFGKKTTAEHPLGRLLSGLYRGDTMPYLHRAVARQVLERPYDPEDYTDTEADEALLWEAVARFGGNFTDTLTLKDPVTGRLEPAAHVACPRTQVVAIQHRLGVVDHEAVGAELLDHHASNPDVPFGRTYRAEILMWRGEYEAAMAEFDAIWDRYRTRWGYVGRAGCRVLLGRYEEAIAIYAPQAFDFLPGEASLTYRGEAYRRLGRLDEAVADLEAGIDGRPTRASSHVNLALTHLAAGRPLAARRIADAFAERWPVVVWEACRLAGVPPTLRPHDDVLGDVLEAALTAMRGNRSSYLLTFFDAEGRWRRLPAEPMWLRQWRDTARQLAPKLAVDAAWTALERDPFALLEGV